MEHKPQRNMISYRDFLTALRSLEIERTQPVIVHTSLSAFGEVLGGAQTVLGALLSLYDTVVMPTFTYATMITPEAGPADNAIEYGKGRDANRMAAIFRPDMPVDRLMGVTADALQRHPHATRSLHPILSFAGVNASVALESQTYSEPLAPIGVMANSQGWALLLGVNHTVNTSIHYGERLAGRKQFVRWALTQHGARECPRFPGCSEGFQAIAPHLEGVVRAVMIGLARVQAIPLRELVKTVRDTILADPLALLCDKEYCERCNTVREEIRKKTTS